MQRIGAGEEKPPGGEAGKPTNSRRGGGRGHRGEPAPPPWRRGGGVSKTVEDGEGVDTTAACGVCRGAAGVSAPPLPSVFLTLMATSSASSANGAVLPPPEVAAARGERGRPTVFVARRGGSLSIGVARSRWQKAEILIEGGARGVVYMIFPPGGKEGRAGSNEEGGWVVVSFPVSGGGLYRRGVRPKTQGGGERGFPDRRCSYPSRRQGKGKLKGLRPFIPKRRRSGTRCGLVTSTRQSSSTNRQRVAGRLPGTVRRRCWRFQEKLWRGWS